MPSPVCLAARFWPRCACSLGSPLGRSAPGLRFQTDLRGDVMIIGNTVGFDCRTESPDPVQGSVDRSRCFDQVSTLPSFVSDPRSTSFSASMTAGSFRAEPASPASRRTASPCCSFPTGPASPMPACTGRHRDDDDPGRLAGGP